MRVTDSCFARAPKQDQWWGYCKQELENEGDDTQLTQAGRAERQLHNEVRNLEAAMDAAAPDMDTPPPQQAAGAADDTPQKPTDPAKSKADDDHGNKHSSQSSSAGQSAGGQQIYNKDGKKLSMTPEARRMRFLRASRSKAGVPEEIVQRFADKGQIDSLFEAWKDIRANRAEHVQHVYFESSTAPEQNLKKASQAYARVHVGSICSR